MKDPKRLLADDDLATLAPELFDGLRALQHEAPDAAVVARAQRALEALPAHPRPAWSLRAGTLASIGAIVTAAGLTVLLLRTSDAPAPAVVPAPRAPAPIASSAPVAPDPATPAEVPAVADEPAIAQPQPSAATPRAARGKRAPRDVPASAPPTSQLQPPTAASAAVAAPEASAAAAPVTAAPAQPSVDAARVPDATSQAKGPEPTDEAGLLFRAKRLAPREPETALRLLETHAFYFPQGAFVQEREVLAIRLLERVGRHAQAAERATRFRARFPGSVYRGAEPP